MVYFIRYIARCSPIIIDAFKEAFSDYPKAHSIFYSELANSLNANDLVKYNYKQDEYNNDICVIAGNLVHVPGIRSIFLLQVRHIDAFNV